MHAMQEDGGCACQDRTDWLNLYNAIQNDAIFRANELFISKIFHFLFFSGLISKMVTEQLGRECAGKESLHI